MKKIINAIKILIKIKAIIQSVAEHNKHRVEWCTVASNKRMTKNKKVNQSKKRITLTLHIVTHPMMKDTNNPYNNKAQQAGNP